jgi:DNA-binding MarR family transcriptional regulator
MNETPTSSVEQVDTSYLETLIGYNARRVALKVIAVFLERMAPHGLRPVDFSMLSLIHHNPGITSRQLSATLAIQPPNLVGMIGSLEKRDLVRRRPHPHDGRAQGLYLTTHGQAVMTEAESIASSLEQEMGEKRLTPAELKTLIRLLRKMYL